MGQLIRFASLLLCGVSRVVAQVRFKGAKSNAARSTSGTASAKKPLVYATRNGPSGHPEPVRSQPFGGLCCGELLPLRAVGQRSLPPAV